MSLQAANYYARKRRRSFHTSGLFQTHSIGVSELVATTALFPVRSSPVTFHARIKVTGATCQGLVCEFGGSARGVAIWVEPEKIGFHAGVSGTAGGVDLIYDRGAALPVGLEVDIVAACVPGNGEGRLWLDGIEVARGAATNGTFSSTWAATGDGSVGAAVQGTTVGIVPGASQVAPDSFALVSPLSVFVGQVPRHFG